MNKPGSLILIEAIMADSTTVNVDKKKLFNEYKLENKTFMQTKFEKTLAKVDKI